MPINSSFDKDYLFQQTFLGASITNFNANMGFNSNSGSININLVEDPQNKRVPNAIDEGYHIWDKDKGFPDGAALDYKAAGDSFYSPVVGSPAYFTYYKSKIKNCGECGTYTIVAGKPVWNVDTQYSNESDCLAANKIWKPPAVVDKRKAEEAGDLVSIYEFNGIIKSYKRDTSSNGVKYSVTLEDPRSMLEGTQVILDGFESPTAIADASYNMITEFRNGKYLNRRYYKHGAIGYYNILNPFGYYEYFQFGSADVTSNGMPWVKILDALATILKGRYDIWVDDNGDENNLERFGGPLYYVRDGRGSQKMKASEPVNVHRYQVDLKDMYNLHTSQGGPLGDDFRIKANSMSLLGLIQKICETAGADFFVELLVKEADGITPIAAKKADDRSDYSGIIKISPIPRDAPIIPGQIQKEIDTATDQSKCAATATHQWANRIISHNMGYEFKDPVSGIMMVGGPRTRVVGVTAMGWFPAINVQGEIGGGMIRHRFAVGSDKLREFMPSIDQDGVTFSNPGWKYPLHLPDDSRGVSVDQINPITGAMWNVNNPLGPVSNDDVVAWQHALTPQMNGKLDQLEYINAVAPNFQYAGISAGDGLIDLYPCWGFLRGADQFKGAFASSSYLAPKAKGVPIKGRFNDDDAYRDFDTGKGIFSIFEYYDYDYKATGANNMGPCFLYPYNSKCPAYPVPKGGLAPILCYEKAGNINGKPMTGCDEKNPAGAAIGTPKDEKECKTCGGAWFSKGGGAVTYRYKLLNKTYHSNAKIRVPDPVTGGTKLVKNPQAGRLKSWVWVKPATATIPIDLGELGYTKGPVTPVGDFSHFYYATITELRAAGSGFESWKEYTQIFAPWLHCDLGLSTCPMIASAGFSSLSGGGIMLENLAPPPVDAAAPLPAADMRVVGIEPVVHHFNRWLGIVPPMAGDEDFDGRNDKLVQTTRQNIPGADQKENFLLEKIFERVQAALRFYGQKYLMALPFTPPDDTQHIRKIGDVAFEYEQKWDISSDGWVDIDNNTPEMGKRYPHNINFYSGDGNLEPFVVHPTFERQRISKGQNRIWIEGEAQTRSSQDIHHTQLQDSLGGGSSGKTFVKASVDRTTYWLWSASTYDIQTNKVSAGTIKPYALVSAGNKAYYDHNDIVTTGPQYSTPNTRGTHDAKYYISVLSLGQIPLGETDGRYIFNANFIYNTTTNIYHHSTAHGGASSDVSKFNIIQAAHKPWAAAVPQQSNRFKWGPWALGTGFGKAVYEEDNSYNPAAFGGFDNMEVAGIEKCKAAVEPNQLTSGWAIEKGSITLAGLPSPADGDGSSRGIMGRQLMGQGPYITDVSLDISTGGVTTTYNMQTQRKFGKLNEIYENRMRQQASDLIKTAKEIEDLRGSM